MRPRVIDESGQKRVVEQPDMIPAATTLRTPLDSELGTSRERVRGQGRQAQRASEVDRHPTLGDHRRGTEPVGRAAGHDARRGDLLDRPLVARPVVVGEPAGGRDARRRDEREHDEDEGQRESGAARV